MRKLSALLLAGVMVFSLSACGTSASSESAEDANAANTASVVEETTEAETPETITITSLNGNKEETQLEVPYDPQRIAILDLAALDIIDNLGMGDRVVGTADTAIDYLASYAENEQIQPLGTIKEADLEAVMACEPDVIFIGGRLSASYDALSEIAPVVYLATDTEIGVVESVTKNAATIASMFGLTSEIEEKTADFAQRIEALQAVAEGKSAVVGMTTSGSFNILGNDGRCSIIGVEIGFENVGASVPEESENGGSESNAAGNTSAHGNESSFETVVSMNPDYVFVLDRDSAIGTDGAQMAQEIMENELIMGIDAYQNGNIVYLENPAVWYTAEGGITALDMMLGDLEASLLQ